uniref:Uncharacterized protein n=1 Tax=Romanomermis culicivorax TaxID=13658 RepID=A0A915JQU3_ROMCU
KFSSTNDINDSTDLDPLYSRFDNCPNRKYFKVGYLLTLNLRAKSATKNGDKISRSRSGSEIFVSDRGPDGLFFVQSQSKSLVFRENLDQKLIESRTV